MIVDVTSKYKEKSGGNTYNYSTYTNAGVPYVPTPPAKISFINTTEPIIENYQEDYAPLYGDDPIIQLVCYDETGRRIYQSDQPIITENDDGLINTITFELGFASSGYILLYPTK
jgi:hypothetical protein